MKDYGLEKVPTEVLLRNSQMEVGKLHAEIEELKYELRIAKESLRPEIKALQLANSALVRVIDEYVAKKATLNDKALLDIYKAQAMQKYLQHFASQKHVIEKRNAKIKILESEKQKLFEQLVALNLKHKISED